MTPAQTPGQYRVEIFPTIRGQYNVRLFGAIGDTEVDAVVEPEEVFSAERIQFPEPQPDVRELQEQTQQQMAGLGSRLQTAQFIAIGGAIVGLLGVVLGFVALRRPR